MKIQSIRTFTASEADGCRPLQSDTHIGLFNFLLTSDNKLKGYRLFKAIAISKHPFSKTRILLVRTGRLTLKLYNYAPQFSFHKSSLIYGVHILFLRLTWNRF